MITVLCVEENSVYQILQGFDPYPASRNAYTFTGNNPIIAHPPCAQWSKLKGMAYTNAEEKDLAFFWLEKVQKNTGIFEHPVGSSFFREAGIKPTISIDQSWWGFPARKPTALYFHGIKPIAFPLSFDMIERKTADLHSSSRSITVPALALWFQSCINFSHLTDTTMKSFQERMYTQGFIIKDYEKCKPFCDEIDRLERLALEETQRLSIANIQNISRKLQALRKEALSYFVRNPLGHPHPKSTGNPQGIKM